MWPYSNSTLGNTSHIRQLGMCHQNCQRWQLWPHKKVWIQLPALAVMKAPIKTANAGSSTDTFRTVHVKLPTLAVLRTLFGPTNIFKDTHPFKTANAGSSTDTFRTVHSKLPTLAVLRTLFGPTNFGAIKTANLGSCMDTFRTEHKSVHKTASVGSFDGTFLAAVFGWLSQVFTWENQQHAAVINF